MVSKSVRRWAGVFLFSVSPALQPGVITEGLEASIFLKEWFRLTFFVGSGCQNLSLASAPKARMSYGFPKPAPTGWPNSAGKSARRPPFRWPEGTRGKGWDTGNWFRVPGQQEFFLRTLTNPKKLGCLQKLSTMCAFVCAPDMAQVISCFPQS